MPNRMYFGVYVPGWLQDLSAVTAFEASARKPVAVIMWYQQWGVLDGSQNFQPGWMNNVRRHGSIPLVTWEPWDPSQGVNQPLYSLQNIINGAFDSYLTTWAALSKSWGKPYFLRFAHEMNGNWYPWSEQVNGNQAGQFVRAWRHVHDIFTAQGVTNVTWVWCPNISYSTSTPLSGLYPGDSDVNWVGMDGYNWGTINVHAWQTFSQVFQQTYSEILRITSKPLMIAETASTEQAGNKAIGLPMHMLANYLTNFPQLKQSFGLTRTKKRIGELNLLLLLKTPLLPQYNQASIPRTNMHL